MKVLWLACSLALSLTTVSLAYATLTDIASVDSIREIEARKEPQPDFDRDLERLEAIEGRYHESVVLRAPLERISKKHYSKHRRAEAKAKSKPKSRASKRSARVRVKTAA